jgi:transcriptional regulator with XRE-family HTH domain
VTRSIFTDRHEALRLALVGARKRAGVTQAELAARLQRGQSFVSKYERGERRLDVIEFFEVCAAMKVDGIELLKNWIRSRAGGPELARQPWGG